MHPVYKDFPTRTEDDQSSSDLPVFKHMTNWSLCMLTGRQPVMGHEAPVATVLHGHPLLGPRAHKYSCMWEVDMNLRSFADLCTNIYINMNSTFKYTRRNTLVFENGFF